MAEYSNPTTTRFRDLDRDGIPDDIAAEARARYGNDWRSNPEAVEFVRTTYNAGAGTQTGTTQVGDSTVYTTDATYQGQANPWTSGTGYTDDPGTREAWEADRILNQLGLAMPQTGDLQYEAVGYDPALVGRSAYADLAVGGTPEAAAQHRALEQLRAGAQMSLGSADREAALAADDRSNQAARQALAGGRGPASVEALGDLRDQRSRTYAELAGADRGRAAASALGGSLGYAGAGSNLRDQSFDEAYARGEGMDQDRYRDLAAQNDALSFFAKSATQANLSNAQAPVRRAGMINQLSDLTNRNYDRAFEAQQASEARARAERERLASNANRASTGALYAAADEATDDDDPATAKFTGRKAY